MPAAAAAAFRRAAYRLAHEAGNGQTRPMRIAVLQCGHPQPGLLRARGPYARWIAERIGRTLAEVEILDAVGGAALPPASGIDALFVTGSPLSVRDHAPWSVAATAWLAAAVKAGVPTLAICYGHQMLGEALGGEVALNPAGREIGVVEIERLADDPLFEGLPTRFPAIITHSDAVTVDPPGVAVLARSARCANQAMNLGPRARSIQWHPEMDAEIIRAIIRGRADAIDAESGPGSAERFAEASWDVPSGPIIFENFMRHFVGGGR